jgi:hypothetical protein
MGSTLKVSTTSPPDAFVNFLILMSIGTGKPSPLSYDIQNQDSTKIPPATLAFLALSIGD